MKDLLDNHALDIGQRAVEDSTTSTHESLLDLVVPGFTTHAVKEIGTQRTRAKSSGGALTLKEESARGRHSVSWISVYLHMAL